MNKPLDRNSVNDRVAWAKANHVKMYAGLYLYDEQLPEDFVLRVPGVYVGDADSERINYPHYSNPEVVLPIREEDRFYATQNIGREIAFSEEGGMAVLRKEFDDSFSEQVFYTLEHYHKNSPSDVPIISMAFNDLRRRLLQMANLS